MILKFEFPAFCRRSRFIEAARDEFKLSVKIVFLRKCGATIKVQPTGGNLMANEAIDTREFKVLDGAYAIFRAEPVKIVPILNISRDGLIISDSSNDPWPADIAELEIMADDCSFYMEKLPVDRIYSADPLTSNKNDYLPAYRIRFGKLSANQREGLKYFIRHHTDGGTTPLIFNNIYRILTSLRSDRYTDRACPLNLPSQQHPNM
jgi:hypothetical protein